MISSRVVTTPLLQQSTSAAIRRAFISNSPSSSFSSPLVRFGPFHFPTRAAPSLLRHCSSDSHSSSSSNLPKANPSSDKTTWRDMPEKDISRYLCETHARVFEHNRTWAAEKKRVDPEFFTKLSAGQNPEYLWIGCSDSRIPAEQITGLEPGHAFVHRNIANLVCNTDLNVMAVINYAVRHLKVKHIVVCGHYGCGGVKAAMTAKDLGILNPWLRNIRDVYRLHEKELDAIPDEEARYNRLVELNVIEQCKNVVKTAGVQQSYAANSYPIVHGWVFGFNDGLLRDLKIDFEGMLKDIQKIYNLVD
ncbi:putative carbonic anhydrase [Triangularia verruculosa]|uniref:Carbonic anhydrase n=1 Tax=Triangularia verruculosa TaxID=2587418 RepID=A0AAN6XN07_9PEZI|nr:putative carbonic anhydrase [Triangularia verruculosa]